MSGFTDNLQNNASRLTHGAAGHGSVGAFTIAMKIHFSLFPLAALLLGFAPLLSGQQTAPAPGGVPVASPGAPTATPAPRAITPGAPEPAPAPGSADVAKPAGPDSSADPFVRDGKKTGPTVPKPEMPANVYGLLEYIEVPRAAWLAWSAQNPIIGDATALRAEVQKWIVAGKAKPVELGCIATKSGHRTVIESIVERRYPGDYYPATPAPLPVDLQTSRTHLTFEWEAVVEPDGFISSNFVPQLLTTCGNEQWTERYSMDPRTAGLPRMGVQKATLSMTSAPSQPMLVQVTTPLGEVGNLRDDVRLLLFFRAAEVPPKAPAVAKAEPAGKAKAAPDSRPPSVVSGTFEIESLEVTLSDLSSWFAGQPLGIASEGLRAAALEWIRDGRGREIDRRFNPFASGQRSAFEPGRQFRYPSKYAIEGYIPGPGPLHVAPLKNPLVTPSSFEVRNLGSSVEMEPVSSPDGRFTDLNIVCDDVRHCGNVVLHRAEADGKLYPDMEQPVFGQMKVTTSVVLANTVPLLLAINTPSDEQGRPLPERKILTFVTIRP
jgi:hypothetical protein